MPRRKKIEIAVSELKTQDSLIAELEENPLFKGCDLSTLTVWAVVTSPPPEIMSAEKYIRVARLPILLFVSKEAVHQRQSQRLIMAMQFA